MYSLFIQTLNVKKGMIIIIILFRLLNMRFRIKGAAKLRSFLNDCAIKGEGGKGPMSRTTFAIAEGTHALN